MYIHIYTGMHVYIYACIYMYVHMYIWWWCEMHRQKSHKRDDTQFYVRTEPDILQNNIIHMVSLMVTTKP